MSLTIVNPCKPTLMKQQYGEERVKEKRWGSVPTDEEKDSIASQMKRRRNQQPNDDDDDNNSYEYQSLGEKEYWK